MIWQKREPRLLLTVYTKVVAHHILRYIFLHMLTKRAINSKYFIEIACLVCIWEYLIYGPGLWLGPKTSKERPHLSSVTSTSHLELLSVNIWPSIAYSRPKVTVCSYLTAEIYFVSLFSCLNAVKTIGHLTKKKKLQPCVILS